MSVLYKNDLHPDFSGAGAVHFELEAPNLEFVHLADRDLVWDKLLKDGVPLERVKELFLSGKYELHHHEDRKTMQFVLTKFHRLFFHRGPVSQGR